MPFLHNYTQKSIISRKFHLVHSFLLFPHLHFDSLTWISVRCYPKRLDATTDALIYQSQFGGIYCNSFIPANLFLSSLCDSLRRERWFCDILKQEKPKSQLKFSMDRLRNDYRNLQPKKRSKIGWIETHYHQKELLRKSYASVVVIGDSIVAGLRRYPTVWRNFILQYKTVNLGIGGDRIENVLWRINDKVLPKSIR